MHENKLNEKNSAANNKATENRATPTQSGGWKHFTAQEKREKMQRQTLAYRTMKS